MTVDWFDNFSENIYPNLSVYIFIACLIITVLVAIAYIIRYHYITLENTASTLAVGFFISLFISIFWPLAIVAIIFTLLGAIIYYPARYCRKFFWV